MTCFYKAWVTQICTKIIINNLDKKRDLVRKARIFTIDTSAKLISNKKFDENLIKKNTKKLKVIF